ncbi:iporin [Elysia marginata]|uniref:Iporin n=1 Tax=Elysia marginata TaxID=1093978 RepID=A0AAV4FS22_9GAST|nr:iporin [Elysia marginata]
MPSPGTGFCLGLTMDGNDNIGPATVTTLPLQSSRPRTWQGASTIPVRRSKAGRSYSLDNQRANTNTTITDTDITDRAVDNQPVRGPQITAPPDTLLMEAGPVIRMGTGALGPRKRGEVTNWKELSPKKENSSAPSSPAKTTQDQTPTSDPKNTINTTSEQRATDFKNSPPSTITGTGNCHNKIEAVSPAIAKNGPKRQNSKSPRLARKLAAAAARNGTSPNAANNSNLPPSPKKSMASTSSSSSLEANSPKRGKPKGRSNGGHHNHQYLDGGGGRGAVGQIDKLKFADRYKIGADFSSKTGSTSSSSSSSNNRLTTWKDISPTESKIEGAAGSLPDRRSRPESGYFSNEVHSESREGMEGSQSSESEHAGTIKHRPKAKKTPSQPSDKNDEVPQPNSTTKNMSENGDQAVSNTDGVMSEHIRGDDPRRNTRHEQVRNGAEKEEICYAGTQRRYRDSLDVETAGLNQRYRDSLNFGGLDDSVSDGIDLPCQDQVAKPGVVMKAVSKIPKLSTAAPPTNPVKGDANTGDGAGQRSTDSFDGIQDQPASQDEGSLNDYFFDEDFIVQYDGNLQASVGVLLQGSCAFSLADSLATGFPGPRDTQTPGERAVLPHSFNGSYNTFGVLRDSFLQNEDLYSGPCDESEVSGTGSRTSMDVSSSEREMMCSSDMLDFPGGDQPLFTPPVATSISEHVNLSTDSLSRHLEGDTEVTATTSLSGSRSSSTTADITVKCGPHKDAYFLSFDGGSQGKFSGTESESSYVSQTSSQDDKQGSRSISSGGDAEDEQSSSFQFANHKPRDSGPNGPDIKAKDSKGSFIKRSGRLTTWKQIRNLRNLSSTQDGQHERSKSLPELAMNK